MHRVFFWVLAFLSAAYPSFADPAPRPKILGISLVRFKSTELEKSTAFYSKLLGLGSGYAGCEKVTNPCFVINPFQHVELTRAPAGDNGSFLDEIEFDTSDLEQMRKYLTEHGIKTTGISRRPNGLPFFELDDPEHNRIAFTQQGRGFIEPGIEEGKKGRGNAAEQVSNRLIHAGFVVNDFELMKKFYVDSLGFRLYWYGGFKDDGVDWYEIQVPEGNNWVEFMLNISPTADHKELGVQNHFSLGVANVHSAARQLRARGATTFDGPEVGRDGKDSLDIYDPDFTRVEVMDFTPSKEPCCHAYTAAHPKP